MVQAVAVKLTLAAEAALGAPTEAVEVAEEMAAQES
jgi:hypothetical protein